MSFFVLAVPVLFVAVYRLFLVAASRGLLSSCGTQLLISVTSLLAEHRLQEFRIQESWYTGLPPPQHVGTFQTRDQTCVPCTGRQILIHCTTMEVQRCHLN